MAKFLHGTNHGVIVNCEAAGNSAALSAVTTISDPSKKFVAAGGTFEFSHDIYIFAVQIWGDAANLTQVTLQDSQFSGVRKLFDSRSNQPAETSTARASGFHDLRHCPIKIPSGDIPEWNFLEDASTNVEPHIVSFFCEKNPAIFNGPKHFSGHVIEPASAIEVTLAHDGDTAVTWDRSTNILGPSNGETQPFPEEAVYNIVGHSSLGGATYTACILEIDGLQPGIAGPMVDGNVDQINFDPLEWDPVEATGKELNTLTINEVSVAGSETCTEILRLRRTR